MNLPFMSNTNAKLNAILRHPNRVYLLYGDKHIGKYLAARYVAAKLLEDEKITDHAHIHPALYVLETQDNSKDKPISISEVRELTDRIWHTNYSNSKQKVVIIRSIDNITPSAANALLKNLEDTPNNTTIVLTADNLENVIPTIRSRSQLIYCSLDHQKAVEYISHQYNIDNEQSKKHLEQVNYQINKVLERLDNQSSDRDDCLKQAAQDFIKGSITKRFAIAKTIHDEKTGQDFVYELIYATSEQSTILYDRLDFVENAMQAADQLRNNLNSRMVIENLALR